MSAAWYYEHDGVVGGPVNASTLRDLASTGQLLPSDRVTKAGVGTWYPASAVQGLFPQVSGPPPVNGPMINALSQSKGGSPSSPRPKTPILPPAATHRNDGEWYYVHEDEFCGPIPFTELAACAQQKRLSPEDKVMREGMREWVPANLIPGLGFASPSPSTIGSCVGAPIRRPSVGISEVITNTKKQSLFYLFAKSDIYLAASLVVGIPALYFLGTYIEQTRSAVAPAGQVSDAGVATTENWTQWKPLPQPEISPTESRSLWWGFLFKPAAERARRLQTFLLKGVPDASRKRSSAYEEASRAALLSFEARLRAGESARSIVSKDSFFLEAAPVALADPQVHAQILCHQLQRFNHNSNGAIIEIPTIAREEDIKRTVLLTAEDTVYRLRTKLDAERQHAVAVQQQEESRRASGRAMQDIDDRLDAAEQAQARQAFEARQRARHGTCQ